MSKIRVVLVDDHHVVRRGVGTFLESFDDIEIVGMAANGEMFLANLNEWQPDVAVLDLQMPGGIDGIETAQQVRARAPQIKIVILSAFNDQTRAIAAIRAGALGFVPKDGDPERLLDAIRAAAHGRHHFDPGLAAMMMTQVSGTSENKLTTREMSVLRQVAQGRTNREAAAMLKIGVETVKTHVTNILAKMGLSHRAQVTVYALKTGLITLDELDMP